MPEDLTTPPDVLRWYTLGRRLQRMIGKAPGGGHYPGGPYTMVQATGAAVVCILGAVTMRFWGQWWSGLTSYAILFTLTLGTLFALRLVKSGGRNPLSALFGVVTVLSGPRHGRYAGRSVKARRAHQVRHHIIIATPRKAPAAQLAHAVAPAAAKAPRRAVFSIRAYAKPLPVRWGRHRAVPVDTVPALAASVATSGPGAEDSTTSPVAALSSVQRMLANIEGN